MTRKQKADERRLLRCIEHWKRMRKNEPTPDVTERPTADNCALCQAYQMKTGWCGACPVAQHVKCNGCVDTPYEEVQWLFWRHVNTVRKGIEGPVRAASLFEWKQAATREIRFLQRVLAKVRAGKL